MLITNGSRQCILKLKEYSNKRTSSSHPNRQNLIETTDSSPINGRNRDLANTNIDTSTSQLNDINEDHSILGRLLNCKPCRQVTETQRHKIVCSFLSYEKQKKEYFIFQEDSKRNWEDSEANLYWKYKAIEFFAKTQEVDKVQEKLDNLSNR
jgi:hypothetical protein